MSDQKSKILEEKMNERLQKMLEQASKLSFGVEPSVPESKFNPLTPEKLNILHIKHK